MSDLGATQRWIQDVITDPDGLETGVVHAAAGAPAQLAADAVVDGSPRFSAHERLALYGRSYQRRLVGCLRESYPGLRHALGDELFDDFALDFLHAQPSRSYTLASLGAGLAAHLEATRPDRDLPPSERERWPDFLVDLARLERAFCEVYDGPGVEGGALPSAADLPTATDPGAPWRAAKVTPVVCLCLLRSRFEVGGYLVAVRRGETPALPAPVPSFVALSRRDYVVTITELGASGHALLCELTDGASIASAARAAGLARSEAWRLLRGWADHGLIAALEAPRPKRPVV